MPVRRAVLAPVALACLLAHTPTLARDATPVAVPGHATAEPRRLAPATRSEEAGALLALQRDAQERVARLVTQAAGMQDSPESRALQLRIEAIKRDLEADLLRTKAAFAMRRGDLAGMRAAQDALERLLHPHPALIAPAALAKPADAAAGK